MGQIIRYKHGEGSVKNLDPRLWDIVQNAIAAVPYDAIIRSAAERGKGDKGNHSGGYAVDVTLVDPSTGEVIPDTGKKGGVRSAKIYEQYAQAARVYQQEKYPELNKTFRWGGGFKQGYPFDLMHLDITPARGGSMAYYDWDTGFKSAAFKAMPELKGEVTKGLSGPTGARLVSQYKQALAGSGGLVPPADIAPTPAVRSGNLDAIRMAYAPEGSTESPQSSLISLLSRAPTPATPSPSLQASRAVQSFRDPRPSSGMPTLPISGRMGASAATAPSLVPPAMSGPTRSVRTEPVSADRFAGMPVNYYPQLPASRDTGTPRLAAPGTGLTPAQRSAMSAVPGAYASPKTPQEVAALYKGILPIAPQAPQAAPHVRSGMLSDEYTPPRQMASAPVPASIDERLRARDPMTAQVAPVPAPRPQSRMAPIPATMSPGMAVARAGLPKPVIGQDPFTMRPRTAAQDMYDSAFGAQPPIPATMSASLASSRSSYAPTAPVPASVFSRQIARARTPAQGNVIQAGQYAYTKGPQGYQKVSPSMVASTSGGGSSQVASWRDPNAASKGSWPF